MAAFLTNSFISSLLASFLRVNLIMAKDPFGVGTLTAFEVSLPASDGITLVTAFPAPVL